MHDLYRRIAETAGITEDGSRQAVGHILAFMQAESDDASVARMIDGTPGAKDALAAVDEPEPGAGIMALGGKLMGLGLDLSQIRAVAEDLVAHSRGSVGADTVDRAVASVPGFSQFV